MDTKRIIEAVLDEGYSLYEHGTTKFGEVCTDTPLTTALVALYEAVERGYDYFAERDAVTALLREKGVTDE